MKIKRLDIENFRSIRKESYDLEEWNEFYGINDVGKTNTINALYWLLTGCIITENGSNRKDNAELIPTDDNEKVVKVSITFDNETTLTKTLKNKYTKRNGTNEIEFSGRINEYFVNNSKTKEEDFEKTIYKLFGIDITAIPFKQSDFSLREALCNPLYLSMYLDYKVLRSFLIAVIGDVTNEDIYKTNPVFEVLQPEIEKNLGDLPKTRKGLADEVNSLKKTIETKQGILQAIDSDFNEDVYNKLSSELDSLKLSLNGLNDTTALNPILEKQASLEKKKQEIKKNILEEQLNIAQQGIDPELKSSNQHLDKLLQEQRTIESKIRSLKFTFQQNNHTYENNQNLIEDANKTILECQREVTELEETKFKASLCPNCGTKLNDGEELIFNQKKLSQLNSLEEKIFKKQEYIEKYKQEMSKSVLANKSVNDELMTTKQRLETISNEIRLVGEKIETLKANNLPKVSEKELVLREELSTIEKAIADIVNQIETAKTNMESAVEETKQNLLDKISKTEALYEAEVNKKQNLLLKNKIELEIASCQIELNEKEKLYVLSDSFIKAKISSFNEKATKTLGIELQMLEEQVNGGIKEICTITHKGIKFQSLNTSQKVIEGIKLIEGIKNQLKLSDLPIIFDRGEGIDCKSKAVIMGLTKAQVFGTRVYYDPNDPKNELAPKQIRLIKEKRQ